MAPNPGRHSHHPVLKTSPTHALFESARTWAYREIRHHFGNPDGLAHALTTAAHTMNHEMFTDPLPARGVDQIARSIHRWIITKSRIWADGPAVYEATFSTIQSARGRKGGRKSGAVRRKAAQENWRKQLCPVYTRDIHAMEKQHEN